MFILGSDRRFKTLGICGTTGLKKNYSEIFCLGKKDLIVDAILNSEAVSRAKELAFDFESKDIDGTNSSINIV